MKKAGRKNTYIAAYMFQILLTINENEKQFGIMAAPFFAVEHTVHARMTRCESLLAQTITTNNSMATTTNTANAKFVKRFPPPFVSRRSAVTGVFSFDFSPEKLVPGRSSARIVPAGIPSTTNLF